MIGLLDWIWECLARVTGLVRKILFEERKRFGHEEIDLEFRELLELED